MHREIYIYQEGGVNLDLRLFSTFPPQKMCAVLLIKTVTFFIYVAWAGLTNVTNVNVFT